MKMIKHFIYTILIFVGASNISFAQSISVESTNYQQIIDMMGGDMERSSFAVQNSTNTQQMINWGFKDIPFNYCRVQYDKNQELVEGVKNWGFYDRQIITMKQVKEINPDIYFFATMRTDYDGFGDQNNAPDWAVNYNTRAVNVDNYVRFLADYLEFMHDQDLTIHTLSITKEWVAFINANIAAQIIPKLHAECDNRGVPRAIISDQGFWGMGRGLSYMNAVDNLGTIDLYDSFCSHDYNPNDNTTWETLVGRANSLGKKLYHDETSAGAGGPTFGEEPDMQIPINVYVEKADTYAAGLSGEIFFEIWSRGIGRETRAIYSPNGGEGRRMRSYFIMKHFANNVLNYRYIPSSINSASGVHTIIFRKEDKMIVWVINDSDTRYNSLPITLNNSTIEGSVSGIHWADNNPIEGIAETYSASGNNFSSAIEAKSINSFVFNVSDQESTTFIPDPAKKYYIDSPVHNLRLGATGESEDPFTTSITTTGANVEWQFVPKGNGSWHIDRADGGTKPRLRTDSTEPADMQETSSSGTYTYYDITPSNAINDTYYLTLPNGPNNYKRLQIDSSGEVNFKTTSHNGTWESFKITEVEPTTRVVQITKRNAPGFAIDGGNTESNGSNVYLWAENDNNQNQQWIEIDRGNGYYSYQKIGTNFALDGGNGGEIRQNVYLWTINENNQNQHWQKVDAGGGAFKLVKRNAPGFAINGGGNGANGQNVNLFDSSNSSQNLQWFITPIDGVSAKSLDVIDSQNVIVYPNPVATTATIQGAANTTVHIYNLNGKIVFTKNIVNESEVIDLTTLASGVYYVQIKGLLSTSVIKIIKQ